jgi:hypothetical protein
MNRATIVLSVAALVASCLIGCSGASDGPTPVLASLSLSPSQSYLKVADHLPILVSAESDQGLPMFDFGALAFSSSDPSKVTIDSQSGVATALDTGSVTITAQTVSGPAHSATAQITVLPTQTPDMFATDSLIFTPHVLLVNASEPHASGLFTLHIGHVAHHILISSPVSYSERDLGALSDTTESINFRASDLRESGGVYQLRCLIHPSMSATVVIQ